MTTEQTPLLTQNSPPLATRNWMKFLEYGVCLLVAFPTAALNGLGAISGNATKAGELHTPHDLRILLDDANPSQIAYGLAALIGSEIVLFFLNRLYLFQSIKASGNLIKRTTLTLAHHACRLHLRENNRASLIENILFFWSIFTSLIFAEMGRKALSFLGLSGEIVGFSLSLSVYFATRFASAKMFYDTHKDINFRLKKYYLSKLELLAPDQKANATPDTQDLVSFLKKIDANWNTLRKDKKRIALLHYAGPIVGYLLTAATLLPILSGFMPESVHGMEVLTQTEIGETSHYQNTASFSLGVFATLLTLFFYGINIQTLPTHFLRTSIAVYEKLCGRQIKLAAKLTGLTLSALGSSYLTSIGFKFVADSALSNGYLSYLGSWLSAAIPPGLQVAVTCMLWSHLQDLINQTEHTAETSYGVDSEAKTLTPQSARELLHHPKTDIASLARKLTWLRRYRPDHHTASDESGQANSAIMISQV